MFTVDNASPDQNVLDTTYSEQPEDHKSFNFIELDNGQYAAQPNNRCLFLDEVKRYLVINNYAYDSFCE